MRWQPCGSTPLMPKCYIKGKNQEEVGHQVSWDSPPSHMPARCSVSTPHVTPSPSDTENLQESPLNLMT